MIRPYLASLQPGEQVLVSHNKRCWMLGHIISDPFLKVRPLIISSFSNNADYILIGVKQSAHADSPPYYLVSYITPTGRARVAAFSSETGHLKPDNPYMRSMLASVISFSVEGTVTNTGSANHIPKEDNIVSPTATANFGCSGVAKLIEAAIRNDASILEGKAGDFCECPQPHP